MAEQAAFIDESLPPRSASTSGGGEMTKAKRWFSVAVVSAYVSGFVAILSLNLAIGPVTPALSLARAAVWPLWIMTGIPHGAQGGW